MAAPFESANFEAAAFLVDDGVVLPNALGATWSVGAPTLTSFNRVALPSPLSITLALAAPSLLRVVITTTTVSNEVIVLDQYVGRGRLGNRS